MTPFDVTCDDLGRLNAYESVCVFHALLFAEAAWVEGVDAGKIDAPMSISAINTLDGGIDAEVVDAHPGNGSHGIIKEDIGLPADDGRLVCPRGLPMVVAA